MTEPRKLRVFLCHASQDKPTVRELYQRLLAEEWIDPWLDAENILAGQDWNLEIEKAVESSDVVVVCVSSTSVAKEGYIQKEIRKVLDKFDEKPEGTIYIVPLRLNDCEPPRRLTALQYIDYFPAENKKSAVRKLLKSLQFRAKSLGLETKNISAKPVETSSRTSEYQGAKGIPEKDAGVKPQITPPIKVQPAVCEICRQPFRLLEQVAACDSCGAKYHKTCGLKMRDIRLNYHCMRCGKPMESEKFRLPAV